MPLWSVFKYAWLCTCTDGHLGRVGINQHTRDNCCFRFCSALAICPGYHPIIWLFDSCSGSSEISTSSSSFDFDFDFDFDFERFPRDPATAPTAAQQAITEAESSVGPGLASMSDALYDCERWHKYPNDWKFMEHSHKIMKLTQAGEKGRGDAVFWAFGHARTNQSEG